MSSADNAPSDRPADFAVDSRGVVYDLRGKTSPPPSFSIQMPTIPSEPPAPADVLLPGEEPLTTPLATGCLIAGPFVIFLGMAAGQHLAWGAPGVLLTLAALASKVTAHRRGLPFKPIAINGCGTSLCFYRQREADYQVTLCIVFLYLPLVMMSTWYVRPRRPQEVSRPGGFATLYHFDYLGRPEFTLLGSLKKLLANLIWWLIVFGPSTALIYASLAYPRAWVLMPLAMLWLVLVATWCWWRDSRVFANDPDLWSD